MIFEMAAGLETHVELSTKTKIFCGCTTRFGSEPNTHCCPVCIGLPGTLPRLNREVVNYAIRAGIATNCEIAPVSKMDRKNYVYPDLPKAYQISQFDMPLCKNGWIMLDSGKKIRIARIHIEEDAGKLLHRRGDTFVDYNRGGVPLIEIVSEPDINSVEQAREYLEKLRLIMRYIGVSDCRMQEGSMRCDVNVSVRPQGAAALGTRAEIKNMNSFAFMEKAMRFEFARQADLLESGGQVAQETRRFNESTGETESMRSKEDAQDYRYFREPDLPAIHTSTEQVERIRSAMPELPDAKFKRYTQIFGLSAEEASLIVRYRRVAEFFDEAARGAEKPKNVGNLLLGQIFRRLPTEDEKDRFEIKTTAAQMNALARLLEEGKLRMSLAKNVLEQMLDTGEDVSALVRESDLAGVDGEALEKLCGEAIAGNPAAVSDYRAGKEKALKALVGNVMKASKGKADARAAEKKLIELIRRA